MVLTWFQLVLIFIFANSTSKIIQKTALKDEEVDPTAFSAFFLFVTGLFTVPFLFGEKIVYAAQIRVWLFVILSAVFYTASTLFYYHALKETEISQVETIVTSRSVWMMLLGVIFFHEALTWSKFTGVFLIFAGLAVIYWKGQKFAGFSRPHLFVFLYTLCISIASALDKFAVGFFSAGLYQVIIYIVPALLTLLFIPGTAAKIRPLIKAGKTTALILFTCILQAAATLSLYRAYQRGGELSVVGPLSQTSTVLTILFGILVLNERWNLRRKLFGVSLAILGVIFIRVLR